MKRLSFTLNNELDVKVRKVAEKKGIKISQLISNALYIYLMLEVGAPKESKKLDQMIDPNQKQLLKAYDDLSK